MARLAGGDAAVAALLGWRLEDADVPAEAVVVADPRL